MSDPRRTAIALALLEGLFVIRVAGQLAVTRGRGPRWLPPIGQWQSGLLPYPVLLSSQLLIIAIMTFVAANLWFRGRLASVSYARVAPVLMASSYMYAAGMLARYLLRMAKRPDQRWLGGTIPIAFHLVLASWLFALGRHLSSLRVHPRRPLVPRAARSSSATAITWTT
jgi:hypothetical protein